MGSRTPNFSKGLKKVRKKAGYKTQEIFSKSINKSLETVRNWEQGKYKPSLDDFLALCELFVCDADYLLDTIDERTHDARFICQYTGLSEDAVESLHKMHESEIEYDHLSVDCINRVLETKLYEESELISSVFSDMELYIRSTFKPSEMVCFNTQIITEGIPIAKLYKAAVLDKIGQCLDMYKARQQEEAHRKIKEEIKSLEAE